MGKRLFGFAGVAIVVAAFIGLGSWQLRRLDEKKTLNARITSRGDRPVAGFDDIVDDRVAPAAVAYRRVRVRGTFDVAREVVLTGRSHRSISGHHLVTPLVIAPGRAVLVDRGWVPIDMGEPGAAGARPPTGEVEITGVLFESVPPGRFAPAIPAEGTLAHVPRIDVERLQEQMPYDVAPVWILQRTQQPAQGELPAPADLIKPDAGPHLSYAIQWFLFAAIAIVITIVFEYRRRHPVPTVDSAR